MNTIGRAWSTTAALSVRVDRRVALEVWLAVAFLVIRGLVPLVIRPLQSTQWCVRWRHLTDRLARPLPQVAAAGWTVLVVWATWPYQLPAVVLLAALPGLVVTGFGVGRLRYPHTTRGAARARFTPDGFAAWPELRDKVSAHAVRESTLYVRPSMPARVTPAGVNRPSQLRLARIPVNEAGIYLGTTAIGPPWPCRCYMTLESTGVVVGGPRKVKTTLMTHHCADCCGSLISTQTRAGTFHDTWPLRAQKFGVHTVYLIDPEGIAGEKFNDPNRPRAVRWAMQRGCTDPLIAAERAATLVGASVKLGDDDGPWLASKATALLQAFLLVADLTARTMLDVYDWCQSVDDAATAQRLMDQHLDQVPRRWITSVAGILGNRADRTLGAVFFALQEAVAFMGDPNAAALVCPELDPDDPTDTGFDVASFLAERGTVYLIATDREQNRIGPLLAAFTGYVVHEALRIAGAKPGGRLDPPLHLSLDEAANTIPMPLNRWLPILGGSGINAFYSLQSKSQLIERLGEAGALTAWNSTTAKVIAGGISDTTDLRDVSEHSGTRTEGSGDKVRDVPVLTLADVRRIPRLHAALIHDDMTLTIVKVRRPQLRPDIIAAKAATRLTPPPALPPAPTTSAPPELTDKATA